MKISFILMLFTTFSRLCAQDVCCQELVGIWQLQPSEEGLFKIYADSMKSYDILIKDQGFFVDEGIYGFYTNCNPSTIDDLQIQGTGEFFFQISDNGIEIKNGGILDQRMLSCLSIQIEEDDKDISLRFGRSSLAEYKKVYKFPDRLVTYLKQEHMNIYRAYCKLKTND